MSLYKDFQTDQTKEAEGVDVQYSPNEDKTIPTFRIRRLASSNQKYAKVLERVTRPYRRQIDMNTIDALLSDKLRRQAFIEGVLVSWDKVQDANGKDIVFNAQNAEMLFSALPELFNDLEKQARDTSLFRIEQQESDAKN